MSDYFTSHNDPAATKRIAEQFGFCHVRGVFSPDEMTQMERDLAMAHAEFDGAPPDIYSCPSLRWLVTDTRIRDLAQALMGETLVYYRETNLAYEKTPGPLTEEPYSEFHCDARGTPDYLAASPEHTQGQIYPTYRFGIYFRNYRDFSGGLKVAPGSHLAEYMYYRQYEFDKAIMKLPIAPHAIGNHLLKFYATPMDLYNVPSVPGDLVIFSLRTYHAGGALRLKDRPTLAVLPHIEKGILTHAPSLCLPRSPGCRNAIFFDFGAPVETTDFYAKWRALEAPNEKNIDFRRAAPPGVIMRNDRVMTAIAQRLAPRLDDPAYRDAQLTPDQLPEDLRRDMKDLFDLCAAHREFSAHHPLFDKKAFARKANADTVGAVRDAARQIEAQRVALIAKTNVTKNEEAELYAAQ